MSADERGPGKNSNYGWVNMPSPVEDPAVNTWIAELWARPCTWDEYQEMRRIAAKRNARKARKARGVPDD